MEWKTIFTALLGSTVLSGVITASLNLFFISKQAKYNWKLQAVSELMGPVIMLFSRTESAFRRLNTTNKVYVEAKILKESNEKIRDLLLQKTYLIPFHLIDDANRLIVHFDRWLEEFEKVRSETNPDLNTEFTFAGPYGFPFPKDAEKNFKQSYQMLWNEVYG